MGLFFFTLFCLHVTQKSLPLSKNNKMKKIEFKTCSAAFTHIVDDALMDGINQVEIAKKVEKTPQAITNALSRDSVKFKVLRDMGEKLGYDVTVQVSKTKKK